MRKSILAPASTRNVPSVNPSHPDETKDPVDPSLAEPVPAVPGQPEAALDLLTPEILAAWPYPPLTSPSLTPSIRFPDAGAPALFLGQRYIGCATNANRSR